MNHEVTDDDTAAALGSGDLPVLATPRMIAWMEAATIAAAAPVLEDGQTSVGTAVRVRHRRPTPVGGRVDVTVELREQDGTRLSFTVTAVDQDGTTVGDGEIDRAAVDRETFGRS